MTYFYKSYHNKLNTIEENNMIDADDIDQAADKAQDECRKSNSTLVEVRNFVM